MEGEWYPDIKNKMKGRTGGKKSWKSLDKSIQQIKTQ